MRGFTKGRLLATSCAFALGFSMPSDPAWFDPQEHDGISYDASIDSENGGHVVIKVPGQQPQHGTLGDFFTYSRNSVATYRGPGGFVKYANENLVLQSQTLENVAWTYTSATSGTNVATAPDGSLTAESIVEAAATSGHFAAQLIAKPATSLQYTYSVHMKANTRTFAHIRLANGLGTADARCAFDLINGVVGTPGTTGVGMVANSAAMTPVGNGWWRCSIVVTTDNDTGIQPVFGTAIDLTNVYSYLGNGTSSIFVWGAQVQRGMFCGKYLPTVAAQKFDQPRVEWNQQFTYNLSVQSEDFATSHSYLGILLPIHTNAALAPNGTLSADKIVADTSTGGHRVRQAVDIVMPVNSPASYSAYVKAAGRTKAMILLTDGTFSSTVEYVFDLLTGNASLIGVGGLATGNSAFMTDVGNGWFRIGVTATLGSGSTAARGLLEMCDVTGTVNAFTGDGVSGLFVWGEQLTLTSTHLPYIKTETVPSYGSYDETCRGFLSEVQGQNLAIWAQDLNQAAWTKADCTITANAVVAPDGSITGDRLVETATVSAIHGVIAGQTIVAGATTTISAFVRPGERDKFFLYGINVDQFGAIFDLATMTSANITSGIGTVTAKGIIPYANGWYRIWVSGVLNGAATTINTVAGLAINLTVPGGYTYTGNTSSGGFMWGIQVEASTSPSSYIPTFTAPVTRTTDAPPFRTLGAEFSGANGGTFVTSGFFSGGPIAASAQFIWIVSDGTFNNRYSLVRPAASDLFRCNVVVGGAASMSFDFTAAGSNFAKFRHAAACTTNNYAVTLNGQALLLDVTDPLPVVTQLELCGFGGGTNMNGNLLTFDYYNSERKPDQVLLAQAAL